MISVQVSTLANSNTPTNTKTEKHIMTHVHINDGMLCTCFIVLLFCLQVYMCVVVDRFQADPLANPWCAAEVWGHVLCRCAHRIVHSRAIWEIQGVCVCVCVCACACVCVCVCVCVCACVCACVSE